MFGWLFGSQNDDDRHSSNFLPAVTSPCRHSRTGRDSTPHVVAFKKAWSGKRSSKDFSFQHVRLLGETNYTGDCWIATQGYRRVFCFPAHSCCQKQARFCLSFVSTTTKNLLAMLVELDPAERRASPIIRLGRGAPLRGAPFSTLANSSTGLHGCVFGL